MVDLSVIVAGVETSLDDGTLCILTGYDDWGMPANHRLSSRGPEQHGETDEGYRLDPRLGKLFFIIPAADMDDYHTRRDTLITLFSPENAPILKWVLPYGVRYFNCHYYDDMTFNWDRGTWAVQKFGLTLKCPDPSCYDPDGLASDFDPGSGAGGFIVPMPVPHAVGVSDTDAYLNIDYPGNWISYPRIRIVGPITDCLIENTATGEILDFDGITIDAGHYYDIDLRYSYKTVLLDGVTNKNSDLTTGSDLTTWHIAPKLVNSIHITGNTISDATIIHFVVDKNYLGI